MANLTPMLKSLERERAIKAAFDGANALTALAAGDLRGLRQHERAARAYYGLTTEWEDHCMLAFRVCLTLADDLEGEHETEMVRLGWFMLECDRRMEHVVERAEALVEGGWVEVGEDP